MDDEHPPDMIGEWVGEGMIGAARPVETKPIFGQVPGRVALSAAVSHLPLAPLLKASRARERPSALYCYAVWMRHYVLAERFGGFTCDGASIVELGPGWSLGGAVCALLCGADRYAALDVEPLTDPTLDLTLVEPLADLFRQQTPIPGPDTFPVMNPRLDIYDFPTSLKELDLSARRLDEIRGALTGDGPITYRAPWTVSDAGDADFVYSHAVLQHIADVDGIHRVCAGWLKPGGLTAHQVGCHSHHLTRDWDAHFTLSERVWRFVQRGTGGYNRYPAQTYLDGARNAGLRVVGEVRTTEPPTRNVLTGPDASTSRIYYAATRPS